MGAGLIAGLQSILSNLSLYYEAVSKSDDDTAQIKLKFRIKRKTKPGNDIYLFIYSRFYLP